MRVTSLVCSPNIRCLKGWFFTDVPIYLIVFNSASEWICLLSSTFFAVFVKSCWTVVGLGLNFECCGFAGVLGEGVSGVPQSESSV